MATGFLTGDRFGNPIVNPSLPPISRAFPVPRLHFVHRQRVLHPPVEHHAVDLVAIADVSGRIGVEDQQVGQLAGLQ